MKIPYPVVNNKKPFFYVAVSGTDLSSVTTTGDTELRVYRVSRDTNSAQDYVNYAPIEVNKNRYTFAFDDGLFLLNSGRYCADFYYKGTYISSTEFVYDKQIPTITGSANV